MRGGGEPADVLELSFVPNVGLTPAGPLLALREPEDAPDRPVGVHPRPARSRRLRARPGSRGPRSVRSELSLARRFDGQAGHAPVRERRDAGHDGRIGFHGPRPNLNWRFDRSTGRRHPPIRTTLEPARQLPVRMPATAAISAHPPTREVPSMARKPSARRPKRSAKSGKSKSTKQIKRKRPVPTKAKGSARKASPAPRLARKVLNRAASKAPLAAKPAARPTREPAPQGEGLRPGRSPQAGEGRQGRQPWSDRRWGRGPGQDPHGAASKERWSSRPSRPSARHREPRDTHPAGAATAAARPRSRALPDWPGESLTVGMMAPEFSLPSTLGRKVSLNEFRGKRVILYFYPEGRHARLHHGSMRVPRPPARASSQRTRSCSGSASTTS